MNQMQMAEEVDIEEYGKAGKQVPPAQKYRIRIDKEYRVSQKPELTGREILALVGKASEQFILSQKLHGGRVKPVGPDEVVDLRVSGVERFMTTPRDSTEGEVSVVRREFRLPQGDESYLEARNFVWETMIEASSRWLIIHGYPIPPGYNHTEASVALMVNPCYPDAEFDMVYFRPQLALTNGRAINALATHQLLGMIWQRWSRHRTSRNPWRPGVDDVSTHLILVDEWLGRELDRR